MIYVQLFYLFQFLKLLYKLAYIPLKQATIVSYFLYLSNLLYIFFRLCYNKKGGNMKQIIVDDEKCIGCGACVAIDSEHFDFNEDGLSQVISQDNLESENLANAISSCPVNAIKIVKKDENKCSCEDCHCDDCHCDDCHCDDECHCEECN